MPKFDFKAGPISVSGDPDKGTVNVSGPGGEVDVNKDEIAVKTDAGTATANGQGLQVTTSKGKASAGKDGFSFDSGLGHFGIGAKGVEFQPADPTLGPDVNVNTELTVGLNGGLDLNARVGGDGSPIRLAPLDASLGGRVGLDANLAGRMGLDGNLGGRVGLDANLGGSGTPIRIDPLQAKVDGDLGINATLAGGAAPITLAPLKLELAPPRLRADILIEFRLFGLRISSIRINGNID